MLNPALSHLSSELIGKIVEHVADTIEYSAAKRLKRLSVVDRAFTLYCQSHLFTEVTLSGTKSEMIQTMKKVTEILKHKQSSSISFVRKMRFNIGQQADLSWLPQDRSFISLMEILSRASRPPYKLKIFDWDASTTSAPDKVVKGIVAPFFSKSLKSMIIWKSLIPTSTLPSCPTLKHLLISSARFSSESGGTHSGHRKLPMLRKLDVRLSFDVVRHMLPSEGSEQVADLSMQILLMSPEDEENMALAQPIMDVAHESLQELNLQHSHVIPGSDSEDEMRGYLLLAGFLNLRKLHRLRTFELRLGIYDDDDDRDDVIKDITSVLATTPKSNSLARIYLRIQVHGRPPFKENFQVTKSQKWKELSKEVVRISSGKPLRFELDMGIRRDGATMQLYGHIEKEITESLKTTEGVELEFANEVTRKVKRDAQNLDWDTDSDIESDY